MTVRSTYDSGDQSGDRRLRHRSDGSGGSPCVPRRRIFISVAVPDSAGWAAGTRHSVRLFTGKLLNNDSTRSVALTFDIVANTPTSRLSPPSTTSASPVDPEREASAQRTASSAGPTANDLASPTLSSSAGPSQVSSSPALTGSAPASTSTPPVPSTMASRPDPTGSRAASRRRANVQQGIPADPSTRRAAASGKSSGRSLCVAQAPVVTLTSRKTVRGVPVVDLGGSLNLAGAGFCGSIGGSRIAVQIDDGRVARRDSSVNLDRTIWQIIDVADDGTFDTTIRLPNDGQTIPGFADGSHRLRLVTGTLRADDPSRSERTIEFVVATGNHAGVLPEPTSVPQPVDPVIALVGPKDGAVTAARSGSTVRLRVPDLEPGDWVYSYVFEDGSAAPKKSGSWVQLDADRSVAVDDEVLDGAASGLRLTLQARDGTLVGWATVAPASTQSATSESQMTSSEGGTRSVGPTTRSPRPLVVGGGVVLVLIGVASLAQARRRRRWLLRDLNGK